MKISELIAHREEGISFEFFPPKTRKGEEQLFDTLAKLRVLKPGFVSVTGGVGRGKWEGTRSVVKYIKEELSLVAMPHLTCISRGEDEIRAILQDYLKMGIKNLLALRGDLPEDISEADWHNGMCYAEDLVRVAVSYREFSVGVGVYPEGGIESPDLETDMYYTKRKIDTGADFGITQLFFDNRVFYDFMERAEKAGISIPILAGIMPIYDIEKILDFSQKCGATLPASIVGKMRNAASAAEAAKYSVEFTTRQCEDLRQNGVRFLHFYTLNRSEEVTAIVRNLGLAECA